MPVELIQIVDTNDMPIGVATREKAHKEGLYHRTVRIIIESPDGQILVQTRSANVAYPNRLCISAAGHVDAGETHDEAAVRELQEELGITGKLQKIEIFADHLTEGSKTINRFVGVYKLVVPRNTEFHLQPEEVSEVRWYDVEEVRAIIRDTSGQVTPALKSVFERYYS